MAERPRILIPARFSTSASALRYQAEVTARALIEAVYAAGGEPLVMHPSAPGSTPDAEAVAERVRGLADGVLLPGGGDLAAHWSGQEPHETLYDVDEEQDAFDLALARVCLDRGIPLLAVCRGLQVVNAVRGGSVVQDMGETHGADHRHVVDTVSVHEGSALAGIVGRTVEASCYHHQCIDGLGEGLVATAHSANGIIEAVECAGGSGWFLGVQWHPEDTWRTDAAQRAIFGAFVDAGR